MPALCPASSRDDETLGPIAQKETAKLTRSPPFVAGFRQINGQKSATGTDAPRKPSCQTTVRRHIGVSRRRQHH